MCSVSVGRSGFFKAHFKSACVDCGEPCSGVRCKSCYKPHNAGTTQFPIVPCPACGKSFKAKPQKCGKKYQPKKYCSDACFRSVWQICGKPCEQCGKLFTPRSRVARPEKKEKNAYCGRKCSAIARREKELKEQPKVQCVTCNIMFHKVKKRHPWTSVTCSRQCYESYRDALHSEKRRIKEAALLAAKCVDCGEQLKTTASQRCNGCATKKRHRDNAVEKQCTRCGASYTMINSRQCGMCKRCKKRTEKRKQKHGSRCRRNGLPFERNVTLKEVMRRCKGKCFWCGTKTLSDYVHESTLFGVQVDPASPTIDHVVPLGHPANNNHGHTQSNTVLSCWACNTMKSDELPFIGIIDSDNPVAFAKKHLKDGHSPKFAYA